jgi:hypothetical protein
MHEELDLDEYYDEILGASAAIRCSQPRDIFFIGASTCTIADPPLS